MATTYGVSYPVSLFEERLAANDPNIREKLEARKLMAEKKLEELMAAISLQTYSPHRISFGEWHSCQNEFETVYQKKGWLIIY